MSISNMTTFDQICQILQYHLLPTPSLLVTSSLLHRWSWAADSKHWLCPERNGIHCKHTHISSRLQPLLWRDQRERSVLVVYFFVICCHQCMQKSNSCVFESSVVHFGNSVVYLIDCRYTRKLHRGAWWLATSTYIRQMYGILCYCADVLSFTRAGLKASDAKN